MSLYQALFGVNAMAGYALQSLGLEPIDTGRFRDAYFRRVDGELRIAVITRNGGGNREDYERQTERLRAHPRYVRDYDDTFDSTYATYEFRSTPDPFLDGLLTAAGGLVAAEVGERFLAFKQLAEEQPEHPDVLRAHEAMRPSIERVAQALRDGSRAVGLIDTEHGEAGAAKVVKDGDR